MTNLIEIQEQIEMLQKQAEEIKAREFNKTIQDILTKMNAFGISEKDLQRAKKAAVGKGRLIVKPLGTAKQGAVRTGKKPKQTSKVPAKFQGPGGETWSGRGLTPRWLAALVALGQSKDEFLIKN